MKWLFKFLYYMNRIFASLIICLTVNCVTFAQSDSTSLTKIGDRAPLFKCRTIDGNTIDMSKLKGKVVMVNFFATWCGPCNKELPVVQKEIWNKYKDNPDFVLVIIGREHSEKEIADFATAKHFNMPFAPDPKREIFKLYATQNIPRNVIIGRDGKIIYQNSGYTEKEFRELEDLLSANLKN
jgi:peroxiredoxin